MSKIKANRYENTATTDGGIDINTSGSVGIGTASPQRPLHVNGTEGVLRLTSTASGNNGFEVGVGTASQAFLWNAENSHTEIATNNTERLRIDSSGKVGIGTSSPSAMLDIRRADASGTVARFHNSSGYGVDIGSSTSTAFISSGYNQSLIFKTNPGTGQTERMQIDSSGNVGIGLSSNLAGLCVNSTIRSQNSSSNISYIGFTTYQGSSTVGTMYSYIGGDARNTGYLNFNTNDTERMRIDSSGNVGIGTSSPTRQLSVYNASNSGVEIRSGVSGQSSVFFTDTADSNIGMIGYVHSDNHMFFRVNDSERMRISANGNLNVPAVYSFTGPVSANVGVDSDGLLFRATSSIRYKKDVETLEDAYADAVLNCRPVWYRAKEAPSSFDTEWGYWGFIAEEVAEIDPRLVQWKTTDIQYSESGSVTSVPCDPEPDGILYDRFVPHLLNLIKRQQAAIETLETKVAALEAG